MLKTTVRVLLLSLLFTRATSQPPVIGSIAPALQYQYSFDSSFNKNTPHNKLLIVDFWATWCGPCRASIPHMNQLAKKYSQSAVLVAISKEKPSVINAWQQKAHPRFEAVHLSDTLGKTFEAYQVQGIPHCVVIDTHGVLRWVGHSSMLTADLLDTILSRRFDPVADALLSIQTEPAPALAVQPQAEAALPNAILSFTIALTADTGKNNSASKSTQEGQITQLEYNNTPLIGILTDITGYNTAERIISDNQEAMGKRYDLVYKAPGKIKPQTNTLIPDNPSAGVIISYIGAAVGFSATSQNEMQNIYHLVISDTALLNKHISIYKGRTSASFSPPSNLVLTGFTMPQLANTLSNYFSASVFYEGAPNTATYDLDVTLGTMEEKIASLKKYGLTLQKAKAKISTLKVHF